MRSLEENGLCAVWAAACARQYKQVTMPPNTRDTHGTRFGPSRLNVSGEQITHLAPGEMNSPPSKSRERYSLPSPASNDMGIAHWCERDSASTHLSKRPHPSPLASRVSAAISSRPQILRASFS